MATTRPRRSSAPVTRAADQPVGPAAGDGSLDAAERAATNDRNGTDSPNATSRTSRRAQRRPPGKPRRRPRRRLRRSQRPPSRSEAKPAASKRAPTKTAPRNGRPPSRQRGNPSRRRPNPPCRLPRRTPPRPTRPRSSTGPSTRPPASSGPTARWPISSTNPPASSASRPTPGSPTTAVGRGSARSGSTPASGCSASPSPAAKSSSPATTRPIPRSSTSPTPTASSATWRSNRCSRRPHQRRPDVRGDGHVLEPLRCLRRPGHRPRPALADHAAAAMANADLIEQLGRSRADVERRAEAERALREIGGQIIGLRHPEEVLQRSVDEAARLLRRRRPHRRPRRGEWRPLLGL